jgi:altronate dehydratase small subunit
MKSDKSVGLHLESEDNVATVFSEVAQGDTVEIVEKDGSRSHIGALNDIPYGHKIAVEDIGEGESIVKYGEQIGISSASIAQGEWVHVHNLESARGRGDWNEGKVQGQ